MVAFRFSRMGEVRFDGHSARRPEPLVEDLPYHPSLRVMPTAARVLATAVLVLVPISLAGSVVVSGTASDYRVAIDADENVAIGCSAGKFSYTVNGVGTTTGQSCNTIQALTITASGPFPNTIDLQNINAADYVALTQLTAASGDGNDTIIPPSAFSPTLTLDGGTGTDTIDYSSSSTAVSVNLGANVPGL